MKFSYKHAGGLAALLTVGLLGACVTTTMQSMQRAPGFAPSQIHKVLIVSLSKDPHVRQILENEFVRQWRERGVNAAASLYALPRDIPLEKSQVEPIAKTQGFDTALVVQLLGRTPVNTGLPERPGDFAEPREEDQTLTQYTQAVVASPEYAQAYEFAVVKTSLYSVATEQRLWSGTTSTLLSGDVAQVIKPFVQVILKNLYEPPPQK